jgi:hypothetical protein
VKSTAFASLALLALAILPLGGAVAAEESFRYPAPERLVAFGDVHGAHDALVKTLKAAGVLDAGLHWSGGKATLVSVGDLIDRGADSRKVLDLMMRLEQEAAAAGGRVHVVMGNHELMNLVGELRDATPAEFAAYAGDETEAERADSRAAFLAARPAEQQDAAGAEFDKRFPQGWFAHRRLFGPDGRYGKWLLARPVAIVVGDTAFLHGGLSRTVEDYDLVRLNAEFQRGLRAELDGISTLEQAGWLTFDVPGETRAQALEKRSAAADPKADAALLETAKAVAGFDAAPLFSPQGPAWYRGLALCRQVTEADAVEAALKRLSVARIAVGHTGSPTLRPTLRLGGRVLLMDTGMLASVYKGRGHAVVIEGGKLSAVDEDGAAVQPVVDERPVELIPPRVGDAAVEAALADGSEVSRGQESGGLIPVQLDYKGSKVAAWFVAGKQPAARELAAYRLDRALGLGLVLGTVPRELGKQDGALQWRPERLVPMAIALKGGGDIQSWCEPQAQSSLLAVWDALIANPQRSTDTLSFDRDTGTVVATGHGKAFGSGESIPTLSGGRKYTVGPELCRRLAALDDATLAAKLGDALSDKGRASLLARRDKLVKQAGCSPKS